MKLDYDEKSPITGNVCVIVEADEETNTTSSSRNLPALSNLF